ncbi:MAG: hypothetical protein R3C40_04950 [Parvularculaceae bacterium]
MTKSAQKAIRENHPGETLRGGVLDLARALLAGRAAWASQLLGDLLGRRGHQIERPGVGDDTRGWGPRRSDRR